MWHERVLFSNFGVVNNQKVYIGFIFINIRMIPTTYDRNQVVASIQAAIAPYEREGKLDRSSLDESKLHLAVLRALQSQHGLSDEDITHLVEPQMEPQDHLLDSWRNLGGAVDEPPVHYALNKAIDRKRNVEMLYSHGSLADSAEQTAEEIVRDHNFLTRLVGVKYGWENVETLQQFQEWDEG